MLAVPELRGTRQDSPVYGARTKRALEALNSGDVVHAAAQLNFICPADMQRRHKDKDYSFWSAARNAEHAIYRGHLDEARHIVQTMLITCASI
jgi:hypothetical protein